MKHRRIRLHTSTEKAGELGREEFVRRLSSLSAGSDDDSVGVLRNEPLSLRRRPFLPPPLLSSCRIDFSGIASPGGAEVCEDELLPRRPSRFHSGVRCDDPVAVDSFGGFGMRFFVIFKVFFLIF